MFKTAVAMKIVPARELARDHVFEMFGNLYQVDVVATIGDATQVQAHIIAQHDLRMPRDGNVIIFLCPTTPISIED